MCIRDRSNYVHAICQRTFPLSSPGITPNGRPIPNLTPPPSMVHCQVGSQYLLTPEKRDGRSHGQEGTERYTVSSPSQPKQDEQDPHQTAEQKAQEDSHNHVPAQHRPHKKCHLHIPQPHASRPDEC